MTCEDFRKMIDKDPLATTRAERQAVRDHSVACDKCYHWLMTLPTKATVAKQELSQAIGMAINMADAFANDPEATFPKPR